MKLKCDDGVVRRFQPSMPKMIFIGALNDYAKAGGDGESICEECGHLFGVHDTKVLKPRWRMHICNPNRMEAK